MLDDTTPAAQIYARIDAERERLEARSADAADWFTFTTTILEAVTKCQGLVIDKQRAVLERARSEGDGDGVEMRRLRDDARNALFYVERLTEMYHRIKAKLVPPSGL